MGNRTVWIVSESVDYEGSSIVAVFDSYEKGIKYAADLAETYSRRFDDIGSLPYAIHRYREDAYTVDDITYSSGVLS